MKRLIRNIFNKKIFTLILLSLIILCYLKIADHRDEMTNTLEDLDLKKNRYELLELSEKNIPKLVSEKNKKVREDKVKISSEKYYEKLEQEKEEQRQKEEEQRIKAEEEEKRKKQIEAHFFNSGLTYYDLARDKNGKKGSGVRLSGKIIQAVNKDGSYSCRMAVDGNYKTVILLYVDKTITTQNVLENDWVTVEGVSHGLETYKSVSGQSITLPLIIVRNLIY